MAKKKKEITKEGGIKDTKTDSNSPLPEPQDIKTPEKEPKKEPKKDDTGSIDDVLGGYTEAAEVPNKEINIGHEPASDEPKKKRGRPKGSTKKKADRFTQTVEGNEVINGALLLFFIDTIIPMGISFVHNRFSDDKINANHLKLSAPQKKELGEIADEVAKQIQLQGNPVTVLIISLISIYAGNLINQKYG